MGVVLHDWMKPLGYCVLQKFDLYYTLLRTVDIFVKEIQPIAVAEVIPLSCYAFELSVLLSKVMIPQLFQGNETLDEGIKVAIETYVPDSYDSIRQVY